MPSMYIYDVGKGGKRSPRIYTCKGRLVLVFNPPRAETPAQTASADVPAQNFSRFPDHVFYTVAR